MGDTQKENEMPKTIKGKHLRKLKILVGVLSDGTIVARESANWQWGDIKELAKAGEDDYYEEARGGLPSGNDVVDKREITIVIEIPEPVPPTFFPKNQKLTLNAVR